MTENNAAQPGENLLDYAMAIAHERELDVTGHKHDSDGAVRRFKAAVERALLSKLRAEGVQAGDERAADLFREALAWGYVYGPKLNKDQWERMRDETAQQFSKRLTALAISPVDDGELRTAFNEWIDKTDFIQKRIAAGELPVKYLGWHRADVMRDLIDAAARNQVLPSGCLLVQEADTIPHAHPEYGPGIFFTEDARIEFDAAPQASEAVRNTEDAERWRWATAVDENAQTLHSIVLCHGGDQQKINERADFYRAALSPTQPTEQGERDV